MGNPITKACQYDFSIALFGVFKFLNIWSSAEVYLEPCETSKM